MHPENLHELFFGFLWVLSHATVSGELNTKKVVSVNFHFPGVTCTFGDPLARYSEWGTKCMKWGTVLLVMLVDVCESSRTLQ